MPTRFLAFVLLLAAWAGGIGTALAGPIDPQVVGVWEVQVPGGKGPVRWIWEIGADGRYSLHSDPVGGAPEHQGSATFQQGQWQLKAEAGVPGWTDGGTYQLNGPNTLVTSGRLGNGVWQRTAAAPSATAAATATPPKPAVVSPPPTQTVAPAALTPEAIRNRLLEPRTTPLPLPPGFSVQRTVEAPPSAAETKAGVVARVEMDLLGPDDQLGFVIFLLFGDRGAAKGDPDASGLSFDIHVGAREGAESMAAKCFLWQPEETRSGVRCWRADPALPVIVVGATLQPFASREIPLGPQAQAVANLMQTGTVFLRAATTGD